MANNTKKTAIITGGGSAGHVVPNIPIIEKLSQSGWNISYVGSKDGIEKGILQNMPVQYHEITCGKFRRYFTLANLTDPFRVLIGIAQSLQLIRKIKPAVVFSKGGFVSFPVVVGAWLNRVPVIIHESDPTPGLANRLSFPFSDRVCVAYEEVGLRNSAIRNKYVVTGIPLRKEFNNPVDPKKLSEIGILPDRPLLVAFGGSLGSVNINRAVRDALPRLLNSYQLVHVCGKGHLDSSLLNVNGYHQLEYVSDLFAPLLIQAEIVIARSGATSVSELLFLRKPCILIPLSSKVSRGDQILNANFYQQKGVCEIIDDEQLSADTLVEALKRLKHRMESETSIKSNGISATSATEQIVEIMSQTAR